jgi:hypothetical protein
VDQTQKTCVFLLWTQPLSSKEQQSHNNSLLFSFLLWFYSHNYLFCHFNNTCLCVVLSRSHEC